MNLNVLADTPEKTLFELFRYAWGQILLVKEADDENWKLPGGKIHAGESVWDALLREVEEELGFLLSLNQVTNCVKAPIPDSEHYRYICKVEIRNNEITKTDEVDQWGWYALDNLPVTKFAGHIASAVELVS